MRELAIKLTGQQNLGEIVVSVDGEAVQFKKNKYGNLVGRYQTEKDKVNIKVYRMLDVGGVLWFITQIFFFLISIFGLLDIRRRERCFVVDFETEVDLSEENKLILQFNPPKEKGKAIVVKTALTNQEVSNEYVLDTKAKKTLKGLMFTKIFLALAIVVTAIVLLVVKL